MLEIKDISYKFLKNINITLKKGKLYGLFGVSGSGKTTLLKIIAGFIKPNEGEIIFEKKNQCEFEPREWRKKVNCLLQPVYFFPGSVKYNLEYPKKYLRDLGDADFSAYLKKLGLKESILNQNALLLSAGEKQRLGLIRLLYINPDVLLLDEPTANLDSMNSKKTMDFIKSLANEKIILVISHKSQFIDYFDKIFILTDGTIKKEFEEFEKETVLKKMKELGVFSEDE